MFAMTVTTVGALPATPHSPHRLPYFATTFTICGVALHGKHQRQTGATIVAPGQTRRSAPTTETIRLTVDKHPTHGQGVPCPSHGSENINSHTFSILSRQLPFLKNAYPSPAFL
jgi:hypothetical protein